MRGRIGDARTEIIAGIKKLKKMRGLQSREDQAIEDVLNALRFLQQEEERYDENQRRKALETAVLPGTANGRSCAGGGRHHLSQCSSWTEIRVEQEGCFLKSLYLLRREDLVGELHHRNDSLLT